MAAAEPGKWARYALTCTIASVLGGLLGYAIGMFLMDTLGQGILNLFGYTGERYQALEALYAQYGVWVILIKGLTPIPYKLVTIASGRAAVFAAHVRRRVDRDPRGAVCPGRLAVPSLWPGHGPRDRETPGAVPAGGGGLDRQRFRAGVLSPLMRARLRVADFRRGLGVGSGRCGILLPGFGPDWPVFALLGSGALLAGAHAFQRLGGLAPCPMCLDQREWHWGVVAAALAGLVLLRFWPGAARWVAALLGLVLLARPAWGSTMWRSSSTGSPQPARPERIQAIFSRSIRTGLLSRPAAIRRLGPCSAFRWLATTR